MKMKFDPRYQVSKDGPLTKMVRDRITEFRTRGSTLADIAKVLGFSGPFVSQLLNEDRPARVRSIHIPRIIKVLREAEQEEGIVVDEPALDAALIDDSPAVELSALDHMKALRAMGYTVTIALSAH